jgi:predicted transcriptional regulator
MEYKIPVENKDYHKGILMILNFNLNLSELEMDIVSTLLNNNIEVVDTTAREIIRKELNKSKFNTNNYITRLTDKGILVVKPGDKKLYLNPSLVEIVKDKRVSFEFEIKD